MAKLNDLWVRLGLKSDDYKKGIENAKKDTKSFSSGLERMKVGALAVWAAVGTGVMKFTKDFINATNKISDKWAQGMSSIKAGWHTVLSEMANTGLGSTEGSGSKIGNWFKNEIAWWKQLIGRTQEAGKAAAEATKAFDAEFELANSVRIQREQVRQELNELYAEMRDTTANAFSRQAAMEKYKGILKPIAQAEIDAYKTMLDEAVKAWQAGTGLSKLYSTEEMTEFFANYGTNPAGMTAKYGELASVYENRKGDKENQVIIDYILKLQQAQNEISNLDREMARVAVSIKTSMEKMFKIGSDDPEIWAKKTAKDVKDAMNEVLQSQNDSLDDFDPFEINLESAFQDLEAYNKALMEATERAQMYGQQIESAIIGSVTNGMQALTDAMFGLEGGDMKQVLAAFLSPFADTLKQMGAMIMAEGIAMEAFKKSFTNPYAAIAAGAALIAIGSIASSALQSMTASPTGGAGSSASYGGNSYSKDVSNYESTLTVEVVGKISGSDILIAGQNQQNKWNR